MPYAGSPKGLVRVDSGLQAGSVCGSLGSWVEGNQSPVTSRRRLALVCLSPAAGPPRAGFRSQPACVPTCGGQWTQVPSAPPLTDPPPSTHALELLHGLSSLLRGHCRPEVPPSPSKNPTRVSTHKCRSSVSNLSANNSLSLPATLQMSFLGRFIFVAWLLILLFFFLSNLS